MRACAKCKEPLSGIRIHKEYGHGYEEFCSERCYNGFEKDLDEFEEQMQKIKHSSALGLSGFQEIGTAVGKLVQEKNESYGDAFLRVGEVLRVLYPEGIGLDQYDDMLAITRVLDKLFRIATDKDAFGETPWQDVCGYAILSVARDNAKRKDQTKKER